MRDVFLPSTTVDVWRDTRDLDADPLDRAAARWPHDILDGRDPFTVAADNRDDGPGPALMTNVPASISEDRERRRRPGDDAGPSVTTYTVRAGGYWGIRGGDRLRDRATGLWYVVQTARTPPSPLGATSSKMEAVRVGAA